MSDIKKWMDIVEAQQSDKPVLTESVSFDLHNGYYYKHKVAYWDDYFPNGADNPVVRTAGPASAKHGDNPMQKSTKTDLNDNLEVEAVYESLVSKYEAYKIT